MKKRLKLISLTLALIVLAYDFIAGDAQAAQNQNSKNLQVLKGLSPDQVMLLMGEYNLALGQNCDYCHDMNALEKGDKPAHKTALEMIKMTLAINATIKDTYKISVDCMSCHQGKLKPPKPKTPPDPPNPPNPPNPPEPPGTISFRAIALGANKVVFPHDKHMAALDCSKCHHTGETSKCGNCHKHNGGDAKLAFKAISHSTASPRACAGCHLTMSAGPSRCVECHKR